VRQASIRSVISDKASFETAINSFSLEYGAYPGELTNASDYWATCAADVGNNTCDSSGGSLWSDDELRGLRIWEQLGLSNLIPATYTGLAGVGEALLPGINVPDGSISGTVWSTRSVASLFVSPMPQIPSFSGGALILGALDDEDIADMIPYRGILNAAEARSIDTKVDDSDPIRGNFLVADETHSSVIPCLSGTAYDLSESESGCVISFNIGY
jgi:hypothetical protein